jgi:regulatory protein
MEKFQKNIGTQEALKKVKSYCAYQERCHQEVKDKLYSFALYPEEVEELISQLIEENYLNEERFAIAFAGGKFRMKKWGKVKIRYELRKKRVSDSCIKTALASLDDNEYCNTLESLFQKKMSEVIREKNAFKRDAGIKAWLLCKGYETDLISDLFRNVGKTKNISCR